MATNDAPSGKPTVLDHHLAYGEAAFFLLDSLLLRMSELNLLNADDLAGILETAISTKRQMAEDGVHPQISAAAAGLLTSLANSVNAQGVTAGKGSAPPT